MATYKVKWTQSVQEPGQSPGNVSFKTDTTDVIWNQQTINQLWDNSGCYGGAKALNGSLMGCSSVANWTGWNVDETQSDMRDVSINFSVPSSQQNLRFLVDYMNGTGAITRQVFNWSGLRSGTAQAIKQGYDNLSSSSSISVYDPYSKQQKTSSITGTANSPLTDAFLTELKINDLIWVPYFIVREIEVYGLDSNVNGYTSINNANTTAAVYTWNQIKPEDKTPAGQYYDEDLFTKGYKDITPINQDGARWRFCCGVVLVPYYGKCSSTYNENDDNYTIGTNPDDGNIYGARQIFGATNNDSGDYPVVLNTSNLNTARLIVMTEVADGTTDSVYYSTPTGIAFSGSAPTTATLTADTYSLSSNYAVTPTFNKFQANSSWTTFWTNNSTSDSNFYKDQDFSVADGQSSPDLVVPATAMKVNVDVSDVYNDLPSATRYFIDGNGPNIYGCYKGQARTYLPRAAYFPIGDLWATIASLGCYVADNATCAQNAPTGAYVGENNHLYLGYMDATGITNGTMLQGSDIENSTQAGIDDIIQNTPYTPVDPRPGGGGYPEPSPSGENQPNYKGDNIPARTDRNNLGNIGASATYYVLSDNLMGNFNDKLWGQPADFYEALQFTLDATPSIFDYIISCTYYPLDLSAYKGTAQQVYMGTGAKFGLNEYVLNTLSTTLDFGSISLTDSVFHPYEGNEAFLNLNPYTKISITIPYAGSYDLNASEVAGGTLELTGDLSFITGKITYTLMLTTAEGSTYPILKHSAKVGCDMKLSGTDGSRQAAQMVSAGINWGKSLLSTTGSLFTNGEKALNNALVGNLEGTASGLTGIANSVADFTANTASFALSSKEIPLQIGNSDGFDAIFSTQVAYITVYRPKISNPPNYGHATGYLTEGTSKISELTGFTICRNPDVSGINATQDEKNAIQSILTSGFYA